MAKWKQQKRVTQVNTTYVPVALPWALAEKPDFCDGVSGLWQGFMDILAPHLVTRSHIEYRTTDMTDLMYDALMVLNDARQAHKQLLLTYPQLLR